MFALAVFANTIDKKTSIWSGYAVYAIYFDINTRMRKIQPSTVGYVAGLWHSLRFKYAALNVVPTLKFLSIPSKAQVRDRYQRVGCF